MPRQTVNESTETITFNKAADAQKAMPWLQVVDEEMVLAHIGVAEASDDYATAKDKLNHLICWHIDVAKYNERAAAAPAAVAVPDEREAFEAALAKTNPDAHLEHLDGKYAHPLVQAAWEGFQLFRAALAATPAAAQVVLPEPFALYDGEKWYANEEAAICSCANTQKLQKIYTEQQVRALLATGGQAQPAQHTHHTHHRK